MSENIKSFYQWFIDWYKQNHEILNVIISLPNILQPVGIDEKNTVILDLFEKIDQSIDAKNYLQQILQQADYYGINIYLQATPRYKYIIDEKHREKLTQKYVENYFSSFGFVMQSNGYMKKTIKNYD